MKRSFFKLVSRLGNLLPHGQRRFLLDRLGLAGLLGRLGADEYDDIVLPNGMVVTINPLLHAHLARDGLLAYEEELLATIYQDLGPGDVFYDIGANVGVFSFMASNLVGGGGAVHAFEPEPNNLACFRRSLDRLDPHNVTLHEVALGSEDGSMTFDRRGGAFSGRLVEDPEEIAGVPLTVEVRSVDSLVSNGLPPPTLVKIDVEGGEGAVLEGMRHTLEGDAPEVICELHSFHPDGVRRALSVLEKADYRCHTLEGESLAWARAYSEMPHFVRAVRG